MATVTLDLQKNHGARLTEDGWEFDRIALVTDVAGDGHSKIYNAANTAGMPAIGDSHPAVSNCLLREIVPIEVTQTQVKFQLNYRTKSIGLRTGFEDGSIRVGARLIQKTTNKDKNGDDMTLSYTYPADYPNTDLASYEDEVVHEATKLVPQHTLIFQKLKTSDPTSLAQNYVGRINSSAFKGHAAQTLMCMEIEGYSDDGGSHYKTTYEFQSESPAWKEYAVYHRKDDGKVPQDLTSDGDKTFDIYKEADFGNLGL